MLKALQRWSRTLYSASPRSRAEHSTLSVGTSALCLKDDQVALRSADRWPLACYAILLYTCGVFYTSNV